MKLTTLAQHVPGPTKIERYADNQVTALCTDSRKVTEGALFFCIPGLRADAHDFAPQAVAAGAAALVVERPLDLPVAQVIVPDVRTALSYMAAQFYGRPAERLKLVGITGTKGKTTVSFLTKSILEAAGHKVGLIGTVCSMIGEEEIPANLTTPDPVEFQSLLKRMADAGVTYVVMEVSAHALALRKLEGIFFEVAGFTNLSQDHLDFFGDMDRYMQAKLKLLTREKCGHVVYNADDERVATAVKALGIPATDVGIRVPSGIHANDIEVGERGLAYQLTFSKRFKIAVNLQLAGVFNVYNSMMAAALGHVLGVDKRAIGQGLAQLRGVPGRIELLETETPYRVILDYAHSPDALENILSTIRQTARARVIALFGCGGDRDHEKRPIMGAIGGRLADYCILTSDNPRSEDPNAILDEIERGIRPTGGAYRVIENRREAIRAALEMAGPGDVVVLAGKGHETYQEVKGVKHPFDEKVVVQQLLAEMADGK
ncbi:UDP-N-acetylmuramoyl-L-alanyl-D-glutamate--2,6-diaminopimelate ligase [Bacillota bacterium Meth-B3]|nr:UDP-N-acetylmuramoyl-L-alanyl-D-glutamate--2,6-diaminopimelate ligase [Christensenellaceae bacterium]